MTSAGDSPHGRGRLIAARALSRLFGTNPPVAASAPRTRPVPGHNLPRRMCLVIQVGYAAFEPMTFRCSGVTPDRYGRTLCRSRARQHGEPTRAFLL